MTFSDALILLKNGECVRRKGWEGYWFYEGETQVITDVYDDGYIDSFPLQPTIYARLANGDFAIATPYMSDILADDWELVIYD